MGGTHQSAFATRDVILSLGAFRSPQLLMLSGIGPADVLQDFNIPVIAESRGVGRNLQDHLMVDVWASVPTSASHPATGLNHSNYAPIAGYWFSEWCKQHNC